MKFTTESLEEHEVRLSIEVDGDELAKEMRAGARRISRQARIPGFRKGKAPYDIVLRTVGKGAVMEEALESLAPRLYEQALDEAGIEAYAAGVLEEITEAEPPVLLLRVPLQPEVEVDDYRDLRVEWTEPTVDDEEIDEVLQEMAAKYATWQKKEGAIKEADLVDVGFEVKAQDGTSVIGSTKRNLVVRLDSAYPLPGFHEKLIGLETEDTSSFSLTYPEDSDNTEVAGQPVACEVTVHEVMERDAIAIDDELALLEGDYETLEDLRADIEQQLLEEAEAEARTEYQRQVIEEVRSLARVKFPPIAVEREVDSMMRQQEQQLKGEGLNLQTYLTMLKTTPEAYRDSLKPVAEGRLTNRLLLAKIAELESLDPDPAEVDEFIARSSLADTTDGEGGDVTDFLLSSEGREAVSKSLRQDMAVEFLVRLARGEDVDSVESDVEADVEPEDSEGEEASDSPDEVEGPAESQQSEGAGD